MRTHSQKSRSYEKPNVKRDSTCLVSLKTEKFGLPIQYVRYLQSFSFKLEYAFRNSLHCHDSRIYLQGGVIINVLHANESE